MTNEDQNSASESSQETRSITFDPTEVSVAENAEQIALLEAQNQYLRNRVVQLRLLLNRLSMEQIQEAADDAGVEGDGIVQEPGGDAAEGS